MNGSMTNFLTIASSHDATSTAKLQIKVDSNTSITKDDCIRILRFQQNRRNLMDTKLNFISSKVGMLMSKIGPALPFMEKNNRKRVIEAKVKSIALYGSN